MRAHKLKTGAIAAAGLSLAAVALVPASTQAAGGLPKIPTEPFAPAHYLKIKPAYIGYTGDGTGALSGAGSGGAGIRWSSWTSQSAIGTGVNRIDTCRKSCAGGPFLTYPVRMEAWRPATLRGQRVFTRLTIWYTGAKPSGPAHFTFTDVYLNGGYGFAPPGAEGYCTDTMGQPKAAGCQNITALP